AKATADATAHLVDNGFKNIAFITIETAQQQMLDRLDGYRNTIKRFGLKENILQIVYTDQKTTVGKIKSFLLENKDTDAVLFAANYLTMSALQLFKTKDKTLLTSKALISFDDFELLEFISPSITSIEQPIKAIAGQIFQLMLKRLDAKKTDGLQESSVIKLPASLIKRASTAAKLAKKVKLVS
ncbi:MAG: LacI family transcriptional regulator, partial [Pedobacter sp.]